MSAMMMNIGSNMMGLGQRRHALRHQGHSRSSTRSTRRKGTATNAMVLFLAINTAGLAILPSGRAMGHCARPRAPPMPRGSSSPLGSPVAAPRLSACSWRHRVVEACRTIAGQNRARRSSRQPARPAALRTKPDLEGMPRSDRAHPVGVAWRMWSFWAAVSSALVARHVALSVNELVRHDDIVKEVHVLLDASRGRRWRMILFGWSRKT